MPCVCLPLLPRHAQPCTLSTSLPAQDCILCPIPQYPLYSATIELYGGTLLPYYLEEDAGWQAQQAALQAQVDAARRCGGVEGGVWDQGCGMRAVVWSSVSASVS